MTGESEIVLEEQASSADRTCNRKRRERKIRHIGRSKVRRGVWKGKRNRKRGRAGKRRASSSSSA